MEAPSKKEPYQIVAFFSEERPEFFDAENPDAAANRLATEDFGLRPDDFHPKRNGRWNGIGKYGWHFEVCVRTTAAEGLLARNHPHVLNIFE
jgi:hypothetical protein